MPTSNSHYAHANGNGRTKGHALEAGQQPLAVALVRLIHGHTIAESTAKALEQAEPPLWGDLAGLVRDSEGFDAPRRAALVDSYLKKREPKGGAAVKSIREALAIALKAAEENGVDDEEEEKPLRQFVRKIKGVMEFIRADYRLTWCVKRVLVLGQAAVVGAPKKSMKTSTMFDLAVALAAGTPFLGEFDVPVPLNTLLLSGESGGFVMQETLARVCQAKGVRLEELDGRLFIGDELPQLGHDEDMEALANFIKDNGITVVIIDPLYLCLLQGSVGRRLDPSNLFDIGPLLQAVARTCLDAGATPLLVHHFRKTGADPHELPELEELAYAGIQEFSRQWILLKRRERFVPGSGSHRLWLTVGGSAGHSGEWALDIEEGPMDDEFQGRRWDVSVRPASEARGEGTAIREAAKVEKLAEKTRTQEQAQEKNDVAALAALVDYLKAEPEHRATAKRLRDLTGWRADKLGRIIARAEKARIVRPCMIAVASGNSAREWPGFILSGDPEVIQ